MDKSRFVIALASVLVLSDEAHAQGRKSKQGVPPGHMPPPGACRVWYDDRSPGHQPAPIDCRRAEAIAARDRYARVIYGDGVDGRRDEWRDAKGSKGYPGSAKEREQHVTVAFKSGRDDGYKKGREDARARVNSELKRHSQYRAGDRGYDKRYGSKAEYQSVYRDGFEQGYLEGYDAEKSKTRTRKEIGRARPR